MSGLWTAFDIAEATDGEVHGCFSVNGVAFDSREVGPGDLFIAIRGDRFDGADFAAAAVEAGAAGVVVERRRAELRGRQRGVRGRHGGRLGAVRRAR